MICEFAMDRQLEATQKSSVAQFTTKAAELAIAGEGPDEILNRGKLLAELFQDFLPPDFVGRLKTLSRENVGRIFTEAPFATVLSKEVISLLAEYPKQREQILAYYGSVFHDYPIWKQLTQATVKIPDDVTPERPGG